MDPPPLGFGRRSLPQRDSDALEAQPHEYDGFNGGGDEVLARTMAGRFLKKKAVYSKNQYPKKGKRFALGRNLDRVCEPRGPWRYSAPVIVLQGERTMSSAESFVLMLAQADNVQTMGDRTAGSSANPRMLELEHEIKGRSPRWLDMTPDGKPFDRVGIEPDFKIDVDKPSGYKSSDKVFEAAVLALDKEKNKKPGRDEKKSRRRWARPARFGWHEKRRTRPSSKKAHARAPRGRSPRV